MVGVWETRWLVGGESVRVNVELKRGAWDSEQSRIHACPSMSIPPATLYRNEVQ